MMKVVMRKMRGNDEAAACCVLSVSDRPLLLLLLLLLLMLVMMPMMRDIYGIHAGYRLVIARWKFRFKPMLK